MTKITPVRLGSTIRMPYGAHAGKFLHDLPSEYLAWALDCEWAPWLYKALQDEWQRRAPKPQQYPVCPRCGLTTDVLKSHALHGEMCSRCFVKT